MKANTIYTNAKTTSADKEYKHFKLYNLMYDIHAQLASLKYVKELDESIKSSIDTLVSRQIYNKNLYTKTDKQFALNYIFEQTDGAIY